MLKMSRFLQKKAELQKLLFYDTVILKLDRLVVERLSTITDCGFSNPATSTFEKEDAAELVTECRTSYLPSFNNFRAITFHLNVYKTPFLKQRNYF